MKTNLPYYFILFLIVCIPATAQEISSHKWKERVLIVMTTDTASNEFKEQLRAFTNTFSELKERKLHIYLATPEAYKLFHPEMGDWITENALFRKYKQQKSTLELVLIGLDAGIKFRKHGVTPALDIFAVIDGMPMRQSELRSNKQGSD